MTPDQARSYLVMLINKYVEDLEERGALLTIIQDRSLPRVPVKGVLAKFDQLGIRCIDIKDQELIAELVYYYV